MTLAAILGLFDKAINIKLSITKLVIMTQPPAFANLLFCIISCLALFATAIPYTVFATVAPDLFGPPFVPITEGTTKACPDGTVIDAIRECETPSNVECPPNKVVVLTATGECRVIGDPFQCPDGTLQPTEADCGTPPRTTTPLQPLTQEQTQQQVSPLQPATTPVTPPGPGELSAAECAAIECDPENPVQPEEEQDSETEEEENTDNDNNDSNGDNDYSTNENDSSDDGGSGSEEGGSEEGGSGGSDEG